jgi:hypothetical protein
VAQIYVFGNRIGTPVRLPDEVVANEKLMYDAMRNWG